MGTRARWATLVIALTTSMAVARELPAELGVDAPSGSRFTSAISSASDVDDYVFQGYTGQRVVALVKAPRSSTLSPSISLIRPDGSVVDEADGLVRRVRSDRGKLVFTTDRTGVWKVRVGSQDDVVGDDPSYTVLVKYRRPKPVRLRAPEADDGAYRFEIPAVGGARIDFKFRFKDNDPSFRSFSDPDGREIALSGLQLRATRKAIRGRRIRLPATLPAGDYAVTIDDGDPPATRVQWTAKVKLPKGAKRRREVLDGDEPLITALSPTVGGPGTVLTIGVQHAIDAGDSPEELPSVEIGAVPVTELVRVPDDRYLATVPVGVPDGVSDVVLRSTRGQIALVPDGFERVPPPVVAETDFISPAWGPDVGGVPVTIRGRFRNAVDTEVLIDSAVTQVQIVDASVDHVTFLAPARPAGRYTFGVRDRVTQLVDHLPKESFEYRYVPVLTDLAPTLTPVLGGDTILVTGANYEPGDTLFVERADGGFDTVETVTFVNSQLHQFPAPVRPRGEYEVYVQHADGERSLGRHVITYFEFADGTDRLGDSGATARGGYTTAYGDFDRDGDDDLFMASRGSGEAANTSQLRVFENDGSGGLTDVTSSVLPAPTASDDWRADRVQVIDVTDDGWPDVVATTNSTTVPVNTASHTRILRNVRRSGGGPSDRLFEDATDELMAPIRLRTPFSFGTATPTVGDNWRGLDLFVGDLDPAPDGRPEIVVTHDEVKDEYGVSCVPYCEIPNGQTAQYGFYWGGTRLFAWDATRRDGAGQFRFDPDGFPSRRAITVPRLPPGEIPPYCASSNPCAGTFTPFTGHVLRVADLDGDSKPDVVVLNDEVIQVHERDTSSLQIALNVQDTDGTTLTDVTEHMPSTGADSTGDSLAVGRTGFPDANVLGTIAVSRRAAAGADGVLRIIQFSAPTATSEPIEVADVSERVLPATTASDRHQADWMEFVDIDADGDQDLILLSASELAVGRSSLRILRNVAVNGEVGILSDSLQPLLDALVTPDDVLDGATVLLGDLDRDDAIDALITRDDGPGDDPRTRLVRSVR